MKIIARHERDDQDVELTGDYVEMFASEELGMTVKQLENSQITGVTLLDGWSYVITR